MVAVIILVCYCHRITVNGVSPLTVKVQLILMINKIKKLAVA